MNALLRRALDAGFHAIGMYTFEELNPETARRTAADAHLEVKPYWWASRPGGRFRRYFSADGDIYAWVAELGPLAVTWERLGDD